jgi:hypothetical protein
MEAMMSEDGLQSDERMRDSIDPVGTVLRKIYGSESEEDKEDIVGAEEQIVRVTEQIAPSDIGGSREKMEEIIDLGSVTVAAGTMRAELVTSAAVVDMSHVPAYATVLDFDDRIPNKTSTTAVCNA